MTPRMEDCGPSDGRNRHCRVTGRGIAIWTIGAWADGRAVTIVLMTSGNSPSTGDRRRDAAKSRAARLRDKRQKPTSEMPEALNLFDDIGLLLDEKWAVGSAQIR